MIIRLDTQHSSPLLLRCTVNKVVGRSFSIIFFEEKYDAL